MDGQGLYTYTAHLIAEYYLPLHCQVRTLHIFGTADVAFTVKTAEDTGDWVEDYQLELVEGASHFVQEHEPEQVNKLIEKFIQ